MKEKRIVPGHEWLSVDEDGNFWSNITGNKLNTTQETTGYLRVATTLKGKERVRCSAHRAVALAFIPNPENKPTVNHKNAIKTDNNVDNLEWSTHKEQSKHSLSMNLQEFKRGEDSNFCKYSEETIKKVCQLMEEGYRNCDIVKRLNIHRGVVSDIRRGRRWVHITKNYNIKKRRRGRFSENTIRWICKRLSEGLSVKEILKRSSNPEIKLGFIYHIKNRNTHTDISREYEF